MLKVLLLCLVLAGQDATPTAPDAESRLAVRADSPSAAPASADSVAVPEQGPIVCRRETVTGSNRTRKVCTREEVADHHREQSRRWLSNTVDALGTSECLTDPGTGCPARQQ
ncbi:hypothetical protein [Brevundimonas sp.]|uniref:hypothetical protein n=1 Tax=Brevundimonas sp. TaxID=1871086 RepID=UPI002CD479F9|nr:hypothetical protein [Brevundimonas sp.]HWQ87780.1 hypothetical protein [Brevundimonas sp.]